mmetsp:Transcript_23338/g.65561  ORF Transcript_23338/g.65561 Transcript_23338/m.65561 type:complete len:89 (+) Transcript_23338:41-307(+)|eukprot:CAMPEP_0119122110 /NCGR_PEP_ID=MMETSP1310-20130426/2466_1 /TAXON_ID=464262 /ORGANISM="Genus nov. species nov., Strain RCC2339" /LENGTH=88 /DNA_ID=CAMNT_0007111721 /DNA_START=41 /DNA_END=307 /DNA_ORIENTATION=-
MATPGKVNKSMFEKNAQGPDGKPAPAGARGKAAMFEQKAKDSNKKPPQVKTTWKTTGNSGGHGGEGKFKGKKQIGDGPAPKKSLADLP